MQVIFREATQADAGQVADLYLASRRTFLPYAPMAHSEKEVCDWIAGHLIPSIGITLAVTRKTEANQVVDRVVGIMCLIQTEACGWIDQLYLHPTAVGQGIGTQFVERAKAQLKPPIRLYTFQANTGARRFYERHGFQAIAFGDGSENEEKCPDVLYEWSPDK